MAASKKDKLNVVNFGLALGFVWAIGILLTGIITSFFDKGFLLVQAIAEFYVGFGPTIAGSFLGAVYAFLDGFIGGALFAWFYNLLQGRK